MSKITKGVAALYAEAQAEIETWSIEAAKQHLDDEAVVQAGAEGPIFDIYVVRSFAEYLWAWLEDAGREYGVRVVA